MFLLIMRRSILSVAGIGLLIAVVVTTSKAGTEEDGPAAQLPAGLQALAWPYWEQLRAAQRPPQKEGDDHRESFQEMVLSARLDRAHEEAEQAYREPQQLSDQVEAAQRQLAKEQSESRRLSDQLETARQRLAQVEAEAEAEKANAIQQRAHLIEFYEERQKKDEQMRQEDRQLENEAMTRKLESLKELLRQERSARAVAMRQAYREGLAKGRTAHEKEMAAQNEPTGELADDEKKDRLNQALQSTSWPASGLQGGREYLDTPLDECLDLWREIYRIEIVLSAEVKTESAAILVNGNVSEMTFAEELKTVLRPVGLTYSIDAGTTIVIQRQ
ncbi:MAG: hypothetical protein P8K79_08375 [Mariniblastus sp.]|nr:hypothetical protein [Mariniblastus sp.]